MNSENHESCKQLPLVYFNKAKCYKRTFIDRKQYLVRQFILLRLRNTKTM